MKDDQRIELTKRLLKEGLLRLIKTKDLNRISVTELCKESGINRATFYRHYEEPRDILNELRRNMFQKVRKFEWQDKTDSSEDGLIKWLEETCCYFYENSDLLNVLFQTRSDEEFVALLNEQCREYIPKLRRNGLTDEIDDDAIRLGTYYFAGGIYYILRQWLSEPIDKTPKEMALLISYFLNGHLELKMQKDNKDI